MNNPPPNNNNKNIQVLQSSPWTSDDVRQHCSSCLKPFDNFFNRRHHCRLCGDIFCHACSQQRALIPPSSIVLQPKGGKKIKSHERTQRRMQQQMQQHQQQQLADDGNNVFNGSVMNSTIRSEDDDPDRMVTYAKTVVESGKGDDGNTPKRDNQMSSKFSFTSDAGAAAITDGDGNLISPTPDNDRPNYEHFRGDDTNNISSSLSSVDNEISLSTIQFDEHEKEQQDKALGDMSEHNNNETDPFLTHSMAGLQPPSFVNQPNDNNEEDDGKKHAHSLRSTLDDDLSVSVATSSGLSYVSSNTPSIQNTNPQAQLPIDELQQHQQHQHHQQQSPLIQQQQQQPMTQQRQPNPLQLPQFNSESYEDIHRISSITSSASTNTFATTDGGGGGQYHNQSSTILYGKGLEERMKLAREPLRVCVSCHSKLQSIQEELRVHNSNAMKYNSIDPTNLRRLINSPLAFTLGHEVRKAAYTLNNLLPLPRRMGMFMDAGGGTIYNSGNNEMGCDTKDTCKGFIGNFGNVDGVRIPAKLLERAKGVAVMTTIKTGIGLAGFEFGTGLVVSRLSSDNYWSPPCAIGTAGFSLGHMVGVQLSDHVFLLMTDKSVEMFVNNNDGSFQLGADIGVAVGPLGRSLEADVANIEGDLTPIYTYSLSKGFYAGISLDGKVIMTRHRVNEKFYGRQVEPKCLLNGEVPTPPAAQPLYDALKRCHVYASTSSSGTSSLLRRRQQLYNTSLENNRYGYGDTTLSAYELEEEYNMNSRHYLSD